MYKPYEEEEKKKQQQLQQQDSQPNTTANATQSSATPKSTASQYEPSNTVQTAQQNLATHTASKPTPYQSNWASQLDGLMSQIMNREKFSYDMNADALYQQAKDMYTNQANMGMQNAMAQASALTGGYGSSYGQMVGQQAYAQQMQGLNDMLPELYQNALNQYINEGNELYNRYLDERNYTYQTDRDAIADSRYEQEWAASEEQRLHDNAYQDKLFDYNASRDEAADAQWREQFEYGKEQDALAQENWYKQFEYAQEQDRLAQENWDKQFEYGKEQDALDNKYRDDAFNYQKEQDAINNQYRQDAFDYQKEQDKQAQDNWQAQFDANQAQQEKENKRYDEALAEQKEANNPYTTYEGDGLLTGQNVPKQLAGVQGLTTTNTKYFDNNGEFIKAAVVSENVEDGTITYNYGGKEVTLKKGTNPYTNTVNPDTKNGVFSNGYQPNNIEGDKLKKTNLTDVINGVRQNVWETPDGQKWIWDGTRNEYLPYDDKDQVKTPEAIPDQSGGGI